MILNTLLAWIIFGLLSVVISAIWTNFLNEREPEMFLPFDWTYAIISSALVTLFGPLSFVYMLMQIYFDVEDMRG